VVFGVKTGAKTYSVKIKGNGNLELSGTLIAKENSQIGGLITSQNTIYSSITHATRLEPEEDSFNGSVVYSSSDKTVTITFNSMSPEGKIYDLRGILPAGEGHTVDIEV
jgi:hypothetical protein